MNIIKQIITLSVLFTVGSFVPALEAGDDYCSLIDHFRNMEVRIAPGREQVKPLLNHPLRDPSVCKGPDGTYYLTGTDGTPILGDASKPDFVNNDGIRIWKSKDLKNWELVGKVLDLSLAAIKPGQDFSTEGMRKSWRRYPMARPGLADSEFVRGVQAPEIHYLKDTFWIVYSINGIGGGLLKSETGKPEGPYVDWSFLGPPLFEDVMSKGTTRLFFKGGSPSLFADDDGSVYVLYHNGYIAKLKDDLTGMAERPRMLLCDNPQKTGDKTVDQPLQVGSDGYFLKKIKGKYYLFATDYTTRAGESVQDVYVSWSDKVYGPYSERRWSIPHAAQTTVFEGPDGQLLATYCGNDRHAAFRDRPGIVPLGWTNKDHLCNFPADSEFPRRLQRVNTERYLWHRLPAVSPYLLRDCDACLGPDGAVYMTGSHVDKKLGGRLCIYKSMDMVNWEEITVWDWDRQKKLFSEPFADPREAKNVGVFSYMDTEMWYLNKTFYIGYSVYGSKPGMYLLKSTTGKAEGPYEFVNNNVNCQPSYFQDDDGSIYACGMMYHVQRWKTDMSGPVENSGYLKMWPADGSCNAGDCCNQFFKMNGKYVMFTCGADDAHNWGGSLSAPGSYNWSYMTADKPEGPWSRERVIGPHTGHSGMCQDRFGNWWIPVFACEFSMGLPCLGLSTMVLAPCEVKMEKGELIIRLADKFPDYVEKALREREAKEKSNPKPLKGTP